MKLLSAVPAFPVSDLEQSIVFYQDKLGFNLIHQEKGFAIFRRDEVEIHLWLAGDVRWQKRDISARPVTSGAESFIAGTASCRVELQGVDALHASLESLGILHPNGQLNDKAYGTREFAILDPDNNLITFYEPTPPE